MLLYFYYHHFSSTYSFMLIILGLKDMLHFSQSLVESTEFIYGNVSFEPQLTQL